MVGLLDANILIALVDPEHCFHEAAHAWLDANRSQGWATCAATENACVRIISSSKYPNCQMAGVLVELLRDICTAEGHRFWADAISILDPARFTAGKIPGPKAITDVYLLALAVHHGGKLVTFDRGISLDAVVGAEVRHLEVLGQ